MKNVITVSLVIFVGLVFRDLRSSDNFVGLYFRTNHSYVKFCNRAHEIHENLNPTEITNHTVFEALAHRP